MNRVYLAIVFLSGFPYKNRADLDGSRGASSQSQENGRFHYFSREGLWNVSQGQIPLEYDARSNVSPTNSPVPHIQGEMGQLLQCISLSNLYPRVYLYPSRL